MKSIPGLFLAAAATLAVAGPLEKTHVAADARWVLHLDLDALLASTVGDTLAREALDPKLAKPTADLKQQLGFDFDWRRIHGITLYGAEFSGPEHLRGVLLLDTDLDIAQGLELALQYQTQKLAQLGGTPALERLATEAGPLYALHERLYIAPQPGVPVIVSQARQTLVKAQEVLTGGAPNLNAHASFSELCRAEPGSFFLVVAQGFSETAPVPPRAQVLKLAEALRLSLAESEGQVHARLDLNAKQPETASQMHQVLQGMMALLSLTQADHQELQALLQGTRVGLDGRTVTVDITLPAATVAQRITEEEQKKRDRH